MEALTLIIKEDGPRAVITATRPDDGRGLYKAWLIGREGRTLLGTMAPEEGRLFIRRTLTIDALRRSGSWPILEGRADLSFAFPGLALPEGWQPAGDSPGLFTDPELSRAAQGLTEPLLRRDADGFTLALPFATDRPFPLPLLFCFARISRLGEARYALFSFTPAGWPRFPSESEGP